MSVDKIPVLGLEVIVYDFVHWSDHGHPEADLWPTRARIVAISKENPQKILAEKKDGARDWYGDERWETFEAIMERAERRDRENDERIRTANNGPFFCAGSTGGPR